MKIKYDPEVDVLLIQFSQNKIAESDEARNGVVLDYDQEGNVVRIEVLDASKKGDAPWKLEYELINSPK